MMSRPPAKILRLLHGSRSLLLGASFLLLMQGAAWADSIKLSGSWINDISVESMENGQILYTVGQGEVTKSIADIQGLKLVAYPELGTGIDLIEKGKAADAIIPLKTMVGKARQVWAKQYGQSQLLNAYDQSGNALLAVELFLTMAKDGVEKTYLANPPLKAVATATADQKKELRKRLNEALPTLAGVANESAKKMLELLVEAEAPAPVAGNPAGPVPLDIGGLGDTSAILSKQVTQDDQAVKLIRAGKYADALKLLNDQLSKFSNELSMRMYLRGVAQFELAKANGDDRDGYLDAGVSFARVFIYYPRSQFAPPSYLGAARVLLKIDRLKLAKKEFEKARLKIDPETEPDLARLITQVESDIKDAEARVQDEKNNAAPPAAAPSK